MYALHCDPRTDVGQIALRVGAITSAVDQVTVTLTGIGGHTSRPHLTADLVGALGALATRPSCCCPDGSTRAAGCR